MTVATVLAEVAHQAGIVPLVAWLAVRQTGRFRGPRYGVLVLALAVSWVADTLAHVVDPWMVYAIYPVTQFGLVLLALHPPRLAAFGTLLMGSVAAISVTIAGLGEPSGLVPLAGAALVYESIRGRKDMHGLGVALGLYFVVGGVLQAAWPWLVDIPTAYWMAWASYQACRVIAVVVVTTVLIQGHPFRRAPWPLIPH